MQRPEGLWQQYEGKSLAELHRGRGFPLQPHPCALEPPWEPFDRKMVTSWDCVFNQWDGPWDGRLLKFDQQPLHSIGTPLILPQCPYGTDPDAVDDLVSIDVEQFPEDVSTIAKAHQLLLALPYLERPISFELLGFGPQPTYDLPNGRELLEARRVNRSPDGWSKPLIRTQFVLHRADADQLKALLLAHYPNSAVVVQEQLRFDSDLIPGHDLLHGHGFGASLTLETSHVFPLRTYTHLDPDPLVVAIAAMEGLEAFDWAMVQIVFEPALNAWADNANVAAQHPYKTGKMVFDDLSSRTLAAKFGTPLFAVSIRLMALNQSIFRRLLGWSEQFRSPPQGLQPADDELDGDLSWSSMSRCTFRPGLLLNSEELSSLIHLPAAGIASDRLQHINTRTRPASQTQAEAGSVVLGVNVHRGERRTAHIPSKLRARHCYLAGASGTGKSTLLLNMIVQDIAAGHGVGVLDPHGDLIKAVLKRVPTDRVADVVLFDPADEEYPFALNILEAKESERDRIVSETLMALERYFPASWGPRLERILTFTIHTVLEAIPGATLADVERMLVDESFRNITAAKARSPRLREFWQQQFRFLPRNASDPVLNKLSVFLNNRVVRNVICQRHSAVDFDELLNGGKILLANLSTGLLTDKIAGTFGSFLVTKVVNAAMRRASISEDKRRPWYLYVDEFQSFMNVSVGFERILSEARKYKLVLAGLANQYVGQLSPTVRQAIFGNVGVMIAFRLGIDDANLAAKEFGVFTADEILNLHVGQALVRAGASANAYNIDTYPEPAPPAQSSMEAIVEQSRHRYARPRNEVEHELGEFSVHASSLAEESSGRDDDVDPFEDDLVC